DDPLTLVVSSPGVRTSSSWLFRTLALATFSDDSAVTATGTFCSDSSRRSAVTTTSPTTYWFGSGASAAMAGAARPSTAIRTNALDWQHCVGLPMELAPLFARRVLK